MEKVTLITGASGEMGSSLIRYFAQDGNRKVVALDLNPLSPELSQCCQQTFAGSVLDSALLESIFNAFHVTEIFHLAAMLSTGAEKNPLEAERVNVDGTLSLLKLADMQSQTLGHTVKFMFPSTIAAYGLSSAEKAACKSPITEEQYLNPIGMYGINKLYCERLGSYFSSYFELLNSNRKRFIDFRSIRFPGLISAETLPSGGTSDYGPAMLHAAAQDQTYDCFVRADSTLPFMVMPDAVRALAELSMADPAKLTRRVYNINAFSVSAAEIEAEIRKHFPRLVVSYKSISKERQAIVDSWPAAVNDSVARRDWGWKPEFDLSVAFSEYLVPVVKLRYQAKKCANY